MAQKFAVVCNNRFSVLLDERSNVEKDKGRLCKIWTRRKGEEQDCAYGRNNKSHTLNRSKSDNSGRTAQPCCQSVRSVQNERVGVGKSQLKRRIVRQHSSPNLFARDQDDTHKKNKIISTEKCSRQACSPNKDGATVCSAKKTPNVQNNPLAPRNLKTEQGSSTAETTGNLLVYQ